MEGETVKVVVADIFIIFTCSGWEFPRSITHFPASASGVPLNCPEWELVELVMLFRACHDDCHLLGFVPSAEGLVSKVAQGIFTTFSLLQGVSFLGLVQSFPI